MTLRTIIFTGMEQRAKGLTRASALALRVRLTKRAAAICLAVAALARGTLSCSDVHAAQARSAAQNAGGRIKQTASIHWERVPLRDAAARVAQVFTQPVFIDRRVDINQRVSLQLEGATSDDVLRALAEAQSLGVSRLGSLYYLGPQSAAEQLRTIVAVRNEEIARVSQAERSKLQRKSRLSWPMLTEPRKLVSEIAAQRGWRITHAERIPHDLWAAGELPELSATEQLTVLLVGFDLSFKTMGSTRSFEIVPLERLVVQREYRLPQQFPDAVQLLKQELPTASARVEGRTIIVDARVEEHERLAELLRRNSGVPSPRRQPRKTTQVYTLRVEEQPVGAVIRQLGERLQWTIEIDEESIRAAGLSLEARVSFAVENSSQDALLKAVLESAGLDYRRDGDKLRIVPGTARP